MSKKKTSGHPIAELQKEIDSFKFKIDDLCENELPHLGIASPDRLQVYNKANGLKTELSALDNKLNGLSLSQAEISTKAFEKTKVQEKRRLDTFKNRLDEISDQLEPDEVEEDYFRTLSDTESKRKDEGNVQNKSKVISENVEEYEEEYENSDYVTEDEESYGGDEQIVAYAEGLTDFNAEDEGDLSFAKGEFLMIVEQNEDGWWSAKNECGRRGVVPSTLIKLIDKPDDVLPKQQIPQQPDVTLQKEHQTAPTNTEPKRSGKELWNILKEKKPATNKSSVLSVLKALKSVPAGFRQPTLGTWYQREENRIGAWLVPKTTPSGLQFRDLHWDSVNKTLRKYPVNVCREFSLVSVKCVPPIGAGVEVLSRQVYVALWDGEKISSNIHLIRAVPLEKDFTWTFTPKIGKNVPSVFDGDFFARIDSDHRKLSVLFEFNYTYRRISTSLESDICCGWASLPLFEQLDGQPIPNKNFELDINGGTPFEKDVPLDPSISMAESQTLFESLIRTNQQPRVIVKSTSVNKTSMETYDLLPETIVACQRHASFISFYRCHAATVYCRNDKIPSQQICDPVLTHFPLTISSPDLVDALKIAWDENVKTNLSRTQRKNQVMLHAVFKHSFTESAFGLLQCANIPRLLWADDGAEKARQSFIQTFLSNKDQIGHLLSPDHQHKPFDISKLSSTVFTKHSQGNPVLNRESRFQITPEE